MPVYASTYPDQPDDLSSKNRIDKVEKLTTIFDNIQEPMLIKVAA
jgi:hypothetical protein